MKKINSYFAKKIITIASFRPDFENQIFQLSEEDSVNYCYESMGSVVHIKDKVEAFNFIFNTFFLNDKKYSIMEFGVYQGNSINMLANLFDTSVIYGFDSFFGLPEDWVGGINNYKKGHFNENGKLPVVLENVILVKGEFQDTLPLFKNRSNLEKIDLINIDCDLYSSTKYVLDLFNQEIKVGTIILFDEYFRYLGWRNHEFKAWQEFVTKYQVKYEYLTVCKSQVSIRVTEKLGF